MPIGRVSKVIDDISGHGMGSRGVLVRQVNQFVQGVVEMMEEIQLGVLTREALFQAAGNPEGHPDSAKLEARLQLPPGHMLLVVQLAMSDGTAWLETRQLQLAGVELQIGEPTIVESASAPATQIE